MRLNIIKYNERFHHVPMHRLNSIIVYNILKDDYDAKKKMRDAQLNVIVGELFLNF